MSIFSERRKDRQNLELMKGLGHPDFETITETQHRQLRSIRLLEKVRQKDVVAHGIKKCTVSQCDQNFCSGACWFALRRLRLELIPQANELLQTFEHVHTATIIVPRYTRPPGRLQSVSIDGFKQALARALRSIGSDCVAIGAIEVSFNTEVDGSSHWSPHAQLVIGGPTAQQIHKAFEMIGVAHRHETLTMVKAAYCIGRAIGYAIKRKLDHRVAYIAPNGRIHRRKVYASGERYREYELWLASQTIDERLFMFGLRRHRDKLKLIKRDATKTGKLLKIRVPGTL